MFLNHVPSSTMAFQVHTSTASAGDRSGTVYELIDDARTVRAEIWPFMGFNCLRWQVRQPDGTWGDILFTAPDWDANPVPTRSGHPILFPFPGRMRDGRFTCEGKSYQLPLNDSTKTHAIHGFTPRNPWRVTDDNGDDQWAFVRGEFNLRKDLPAAVSQWPSEFNLAVTYRLFKDRLRVDAIVENAGRSVLPFGIGYHPYFRLPGVTDEDIGGHILQANCAEMWEVTPDNMPTGMRPDAPPELDFRTARAIGSMPLDNVLTTITSPVETMADLRELAVLSHPAATGRVRFLGDGSFRELVLFTPPHKQAVAIEPYSCSADAANLRERGIDSGWRELRPGESWESTVEYVWEPV